MSVEIGAARNAPLNATEWTSGQQLADSLIRYHDARSELRKAYEAVQDTHRGVVKPPQRFSPCPLDWQTLEVAVA
jgi:hypothetical protein